MARNPNDRTDFGSPPKAHTCRCGYPKPGDHSRADHCIDYLRIRIDALMATVRDLGANFAGVQ